MRSVSETLAVGDEGGVPGYPFISSGVSPKPHFSGSFIELHVGVQERW